MSRFALTAERVLAGERLQRDVAVVVDGGRIAGIGPLKELAGDIKLNDLGSGMLVPGFIDAQVNGGAGVLLNETPTVEGVRAIAEAHRRYGTTGLLPTVITDSPEVMRGAVESVSEAIRQGVPGVLGVHIEGPFIDPARKGAHDPRFIRKPTDTDIDWLCGLGCGRVLVTLAPNRVEPAVVKRLAQAGVIVSLGHAEASASEAQAAVMSGARGFTHLFNAMSQLSGRAPGMVGAALTSPETWCGIIADGEHVDAIALSAAIAAKPRGKVMLVSDAMPSAADGPQRFMLQGRAVEVVNGRLQLIDGTLAGATITMVDAVRYAHRDLNLDLEETLRMASQYPAAFLGLDKAFGRIAPGYRADLTHLGDGFEVMATWIEGRTA